LTTRKAKLYIAALPNSSRQQAYSWHVTTRNFFAWLCGKPLVGEHLGQSLVEVLDRMKSFRATAVENVGDLLNYADQVGYSRIENRPDYALSMLYFSERHKLRDTWTDAFAHCVGMNGSLETSSEYQVSVASSLSVHFTDKKQPISPATKAQISKAYLEMEFRLGLVSSTLHSFLEDELSPTYLGLDTGARNHLDNFRSFLQTYHVVKYGYWPPPKNDLFPNGLYSSMIFDFQNLYDYLVDRNSTERYQAYEAGGGICVLQNIDAFNQRQNYSPLQFSLPLVPRFLPSETVKQSRRSLSILGLGKNEKKPQNTNKVKLRLAAASNKVNETVLGCALVQAYMQFEDDHATNLQEKVSFTDARKVRWILIYGTLQTLVSVMRTPQAVRHGDTPAYPLCCLTAGTPPWDEGSNTWRSPAEQFHLLQKPAQLQGHEKPTDVSTPRLSIQPDCESWDYFKYLPRHDLSSEDSATSSSNISKSPTSRLSTRLSVKQLQVPFLRPKSSKRNSSRTPSYSAPRLNTNATFNLIERGHEPSPAVARSAGPGVPLRLQLPVDTFPPLNLKFSYQPAHEKLRLQTPEECSMSRTVRPSVYTSDSTVSTPSLEWSSGSTDITDSSDGEEGGLHGKDSVRLDLTTRCSSIYSLASYEEGFDVLPVKPGNGTSNAQSDVDGRRTRLLVGRASDYSIKTVLSDQLDDYLGNREVDSYRALAHRDARDYGV